MAERAQVFQGVQIGVEVTPGTGVAANKRLSSLSIEPSVKFEGTTFTPMGNKFVSVQAPNREWTEAKISGSPTYDEIVYALAGVISYAAPVRIIPDTGLAYTWTFSMSNTAADTLKTYTIEQGDAVRAHKMTYGVFKEFGFTFARNGFTVAGAMFGRLLQDAITLTADPTTLPLIPILPTQMSVLLADTHAGIAGAANSARVLSAEWKIADRIAPIWVLNAANTSWVAPVETKPSVTAKIKMEADAEGMALLTQLRSGATKFIMFECLGTTIEASTPYTLTIEMAAKITNISEFSDQDGVYAIEWDLEATYDATWAKTFEIVVINTTAAL